MSYTLQSIDSVVVQAKENGWDCAIYDFGKAKHPNVDYFNPGLVTIDGTTFLITRRAYWTNRKVQEFGKNDLVAFQLEGKTPVQGYPIVNETRFEGEMFEDPRAIVHKGRLLVSCCDFTWSRTGWSGAHQIISHIDPQQGWKSVRRYDPVFGGNGDNLGKNTGHEKNWLFFTGIDGGLKMVYCASPHVIVEFDDELNVVGKIESDWVPDWKWGEMRGGSPPVLVGDVFYTFFHSSTPWIQSKRQYHMGCYAFDPKTYAVLSLTPIPLLTGSPNDRWQWGKPPCVFPCGCIFENGKFYISMGINDLDCAWVEIPLGDVNKRMIEI